MELIREIYDSDIDSDDLGYREKFYEMRKAARAIVFNENQEVAILYSRKNEYHKLPGGGVEEGESLIESLKREIKEEVGCDSEIKGELGIVIECKNGHKKIQISYCYIANIKGDIMNTSYTKNEILEEFRLKWMSLDAAIRIFKEDSPLDYTGKFIRERDLTFLKKMRDISE
jgi:ADP-ribose pyrophosphatase YjhB (NUDIX family)